MSQDRHGLVPRDYDLVHEGENLRVTGVKSYSIGEYFRRGVDREEGVTGLRVRSRHIGDASPRK